MREFEQSLQLYSEGKRAEAAAICEQIVAVEPSNAQAWQLLTLIAADEGQLAQAIDFQKRAIQYDSRNSEKLKNLGILFHRFGDFSSSVAAFQKSIQLDSGQVEAHFGIANVLVEVGNKDEGMAAYQRVVELDPEHVPALLNLAYLHSTRDQFAETTKHCNAVLAIDATNHVALSRLGEVYALRGHLVAAREYYLRAVENGASDSVRILSALLVPPIYESETHIDRAREELEAALAELEQADLRILAPVAEQAGTPFLLTYQGRDNRNLQRRIAALYRKSWQLDQPSVEKRDSGIPAEPGATVDSDSSSAGASPTQSGRKRRIGFVSSFFRDHTVGRVTAGLVEYLGRDDLHVSVISIGNHRDAWAERFRNSADDFIAVRPVIPEIASAILQRQLDVLVFSEVGMEPITYFLAFLRLAPIQCAMWGHPETTGIDTIDYYISCKEFEPLNAQDHYTEQLIQLDLVPVYYERPTLPDPLLGRAHFGFSANDRLYYCAQTMFKFHPSFDEAICGILRRDTNGRVLIPRARREPWNVALKERFQRVMPDVLDRIEFIPRLSRDEFLSLSAASEAMLDTFPFGGGTTSLETFATGTPIVTLRDKFARGRFTAGYYDRMGLTACVAESVDEYVDLAVRWGCDRAFRNEVKQKILERCDVLYENLDAVRGLEEFLRTRT